MTYDEFKPILEAHGKWLRDEDGGSRANLIGANLSRADLSDADLSDANLSDANLSRADLSDADLSDANLSDANLSRANLIGANLSRANLSRADLSDADLSDANLSRANLSRADLSDADLSDANLSRADLSDADLSDANLIDANLIDANLSRANLSDADLSDANLSRANLDPIREDLYDVLRAARAEVQALLAALREGRVDGSTYSGDCACLVGTIAKVRGCDTNALAGIIPDASRPAERWFYAIKRGDTPATNPVAKIAEEWIEAFLADPAPEAVQQGAAQ